jgi:DNA polymerase-3 subunit delta
MAMNEVAAQALVDQIGPDLMELEGEIEKLSLYAMGRGGIELDDVKTAARMTPTANVFQLGDAIGDQRPGPALSHLSDLLTGSQPLAILAMLVRHFRLLARAKILNEQRVNRNDAAGILGMPVFAVGKMYNQSRQFSFVEIKKGLALLKEANLALISTGPPEGLIMEKLILDLSSLRPKQRRSGPYGSF